jgi:hypothetical protein
MFSLFIVIEDPERRMTLGFLYNFINEPVCFAEFCFKREELGLGFFVLRFDIFEEFRPITTIGNFQEISNPTPLYLRFINLFGQPPLPFP